MSTVLGLQKSLKRLTLSLRGVMLIPVRRDGSVRFQSKSGAVGPWNHYIRVVKARVDPIWISCFYNPTILYYMSICS